MSKLKQISEVYIVAELSANHNNNLETALKTVEAIADVGADAVKVQTYTPDSLTLDVDNEYFGPLKRGPWKGRKPYELFQEASMPYEWHMPIKSKAIECGLEFFSSPFDYEAVDFLENINVPKYKIASFEITDIPLIKYTASKGKPMIISTGVAELKDIENAIKACMSVNNTDITILKCTSQYPAIISDANLLTMPDIAERFNVKVGVSDHTFGNTVPMAAVVLGASVIEKHIILDRNMGGPDSLFSLEPAEFKNMVENVRAIEQSLGAIKYEVSDLDKLRRRSLFVTKNISSGEKFTTENIKSLRPGHGMHPIMLPNIIGKTAAMDLVRGQPLHQENIASYYT